MPLEASADRLSLAGVSRNKLSFRLKRSSIRGTVLLSDSILYTYTRAVAFSPLVRCNLINCTGIKALPRSPDHHTHTHTHVRTYGQIELLRTLTHPNVCCMYIYACVCVCVSVWLAGPTIIWRTRGKQGLKSPRRGSQWCLARSPRPSEKN